MQPVSISASTHREVGVSEAWPANNVAFAMRTRYSS